MPSRSRACPPWWHDALALLFLLVGYDRVTAAASVRVALADAHGESLLRVEGLLHLDIEGTLDRAAAAHHLLGVAMALYYDLAHVLVTTAVLVAVRLVRPDVHLPLRRALVATNLVALMVFLLHPVTPPRLLPGAGVVDVVALSGAWGTSGAITAAPDQYASLPSLHVAWALWVLLAVLAASSSRWLHGLAAAHLLVTVAVVLLTGNHYVLDVLAGAALAFGCRVAWEVPGRGPGREGVKAAVRQWSAP
ncbi:MAG: hypothetical protein JWM64_2965 [Frankiales bacterium]|nr:hypothetical protein [Frankiales bacterium]